MGSLHRDVMVNPERWQLGPPMFPTSGALKGAASWLPHHVAEFQPWNVGRTDVYKPSHG